MRKPSHSHGADVQGRAFLSEISHSTASGDRTTDSSGERDDLSHDHEDSWRIYPTTAGRTRPDDEWETGKSPDEASPETTRGAWRIILGLGITVFALLPRLLVIFYVTDPQNPGIGWYGDVYHHWQIAYLSKEVGFSQGFLRLWDFKGLEFFWGLLHPLVLAALFQLTGSVDIVIPRLVSAFTASISIALLFFLLRRYFNTHVALAGVLIAALNPIAVFNDGVGMQEPLGLILLFAGLLFWPRRPWATGFLWMMAGMVRAEYWVMGGGLTVVAAITAKDSGKRLGIGLGWLIPALVYMRYMLANTGNAIYPIYWNYLAGTAGEWIADRPLNAEQVQAQLGARVALILALMVAAWLLLKRPPYAPFLLLGVGNIIMIGIVLGLGAYVRGYITRVLIDRLLVVPYMYIGILIAIAFLYILPRLRFRVVWMALGWLVILLAVVASQLLWQPILQYYNPLREIWARETRLADDIASYYSGGTILIPEDRPYLTYALVRYHGVEGKDIEGQMYDPFAYFKDDPFANWSESRLVIRDWLTNRNIREIAFYPGKSTYEGMIAREPQWFRHLSTVYLGSVELYEVIPE
ncbi:MAG TPA: hypothetical protein VI729_02065 [Anaerolineales bacterium]|nr:hypothetical protein [Anaerolineales bacterium]